MTGDILDAKQLAECAQRYVDLISSHDIDALCGLFAADAIQEDPVGHEPHIGIDAIREFFLVGFSADIKAELTGSPRCAGNAVAFPLSVTFGVGDSVMKLEAIDVFEFNDEGKIQTMKAYWGADNCSSL
ncbi:MAG: nuclear transport factor 2 family protein [Chloroflexi bacterium]|nr:nuclear transport factor 2 family protein [Chloroflexota bacterium]